MKKFFSLYLLLLILFYSSISLSNSDLFTPQSKRIIGLHLSGQVVVPVNEQISNSYRPVYPSWKIGISYIPFKIFSIGIGFSAEFWEGSITGVNDQIETSLMLYNYLWFLESKIYFFIDSKIAFYGSPGIYLGYSREENDVFIGAGTIFGLKAEIGIEYSFNEKCSLTLGFELSWGRGFYDILRGYGIDNVNNYYLDWGKEMIVLSFNYFPFTRI